VAYHPLDTIVAVASPSGGAARGVVRLSGPRVVACVERLFVPSEGASESSPRNNAAFAERKATFTPSRRPTAVEGHLLLPGIHSPLPTEMYFWPDGRSYTGQPVVEFHTIGSPPLLDGVVSAVCEAGARLAEPGEFTLRAFLSGRIDLTQAEAVLGIIEANNDPQLDVALGQLAGGLSGPLRELRDGLLDLLGHIEAGLDFADEDLPFIARDQLVGQLATARDEATGLVRKLESRHRAGAFVRAALVGPPNAGKSSLFNALVQNDGAIVSHLPGTTRDYLTAQIELDGVRFELIDTAGIPGTGKQRDPVETPQDESQESQAIERAAELVAQREEERADIRVFCVDATALSTSLQSHESDRNLRDTDTLVLTKADLIESNAAKDAPEASLLVSSVTGEGLDALRRWLRELVVRAQSAPDSAVASTAARCHESLRAAADAMGRAHRMAADNEGEELIAAEIHVALEALGRVAGAVCTADVLNRVFSRFCIGK